MVVSALQMKLLLPVVAEQKGNVISLEFPATEHLCYFRCQLKDSIGATREVTFVICVLSICF